MNEPHQEQPEVTPFHVAMIQLGNISSVLTTALKQLGAPEDTIRALNESGDIEHVAWWLDQPRITPASTPADAPTTDSVATGSKSADATGEGPTPETDAFTERSIPLKDNGQPDYTAALKEWTKYAEGQERTIATLRAECEGLREELNWQSNRNSGHPTRGGYEFYINEEWTGIASAPLDTDPGWHAALRKKRMDPDDERVRIRRVIEDDALIAAASRGTEGQG